MTFDGPSISQGTSAYLLFEGLDTFATVRLNDITILESDNMFLSHRVNITAALKPSAVNKLVIDFDSALLRGRELQRQHSEHNYKAFNGEASRLCVRKAQYHWVRQNSPGPLTRSQSNSLGVGLGPSSHDSWPMATCAARGILYTYRQCED
jgi:hypothetical protein